MKQIIVVVSAIGLYLFSFILTTQSINKNEDPLKLANIEILSSTEQTELDCTVAGGMCFKGDYPKFGVHLGIFDKDLNKIGETLLSPEYGSTALVSPEGLLVPYITGNQPDQPLTYHIFKITSI